MAHRNNRYLEQFTHGLLTPHGKTISVANLDRIIKVDLVIVKDTADYKIAV